MKSPRYTRVLFLALVLILSLPLLNLHLPVVTSGKLYGAVTGTPDTAWSWGGWWSGAVQRKKEAYLNDSIGYRPDLVRLHNQIDFSLFKKLHAGTIVLGRDGHLFSKDYIDTYCGTSYPGPANVRVNMIRLKAVQDSMAARGKTLLFLLAPSKARIIPEAIPADLACTGTDPSIYSDLRRLADSLGIHTLDVNAWFASLKGKTLYPLLTKGGVHWSTYGSVRVIDTLVRYFAFNTSVPVPEFHLKGLGPTRERNENDQDIEYGLNLIAPLSSEEISRPDYDFVQRNTAGEKRPKFIFVGDSFLWSFIYRGLPRSISDDWEFWYYFREVWNLDAIEGRGHTKPMAEANWRASLDSSDALVMVYTEINLAGPASQFIDSAYQYYVRERGVRAAEQPQGIPAP